MANDEWVSLKSGSRLNEGSVLRRRETLSEQLSSLFSSDASSNEIEGPYVYSSVDVPTPIGRSPAKAIDRARMMPTVRSRIGVSMVSRKEVLGMIREVEAMFDDLPNGTLEYVLNHEMGPTTDPLNPAIRGGSGGKYLGIFQFFHQERNSQGVYAWGAARQELSRRGVALPPLSQGWNDAYFSTLAAAGLALANRRVIENAVGRKAIRNWAPVVFYAAHQQGAGYVIKAVRTGNPGPLAGKQSNASVAALNGELARALA